MPIPAPTLDQSLDQALDFQAAADEQAGLTARYHKLNARLAERGIKGEVIYALSREATYPWQLYLTLGYGRPLFFDTYREISAFIEDVEP